MLNIASIKYKINLFRIPILVFIITTLSIFAFLFIFFKAFVDFKQITKQINTKDITSVKIINLEISKDRRSRYEKMINEQFGDRMFGIKIDNLTMKATHGKYDLIFEELNGMNEVVKKISAIDIQENRASLKENDRASSLRNTLRRGYRT